MCFSCKVRFQWYSDDSKKLKWRDLTGPEKTRLFTNVDLPRTFPQLPNVDKIQNLWMEFWRLFNKLRGYECDPDHLQRDAKSWVSDFLVLYQTKNVTPYVHAFVHHVPEFIKHYGNVASYTQEGMEKLNDITTKHYQRSTNHRDMESLKQVLEKKNRIEELETSGYSRKKRTIKCSTCKLNGHNKRSCPTVLTQLQAIGDPSSSNEPN